VHSKAMVSLAEALFSLLGHSILIVGNNDTVISVGRCRVSGSQLTRNSRFTHPTLNLHPVQPELLDDGLFGYNAI
jgi:hypothetical protein